MAAILYLDVDDEITSAAARIRSTEDRRVVIVVPGGSRLATSRINFRLLAREAQTRGRRLWIVAADGATRALAASAGLPIFGSVAEYEDAMEASPSAHAAASVPIRATRSPRDVAAVRDAPTAPAQPADDFERTTAIPTADLDEAAAAAIAPEVAAEAEIDAAAVAAAPSGATPWVSRPIGPRSASARAAVPAAGSIPVVGRRGDWPLTRTTAIVIAAILLLVVGVGGVAAFVFLPSASIVVTTHPVPVTPVDLTVRADPHANEIDPTNDVVPAQRISFPVETSGTFKVKGTRIEETRATGQVKFLNLDPFGANFIDSGSVVSTEGGIQFSLDQSVSIPAATFGGPGEASAPVTAVRKGTIGNVPAGAITVVPSGEDPAVTRVSNPDPTGGGTRKVLPQVEQADIDAAIEKLNKQLGTAFDDLLANPTGVPEGLTIYPDTATLGKGDPTADPATLLDQQIESFELGMTATGSVTAVDDSAIEAYGHSKLNAAVDADYRLVDGSAEVSVGELSTESDVVVFPVTATALEVRQLDASAILAQIKGKTVPQARAVLEPYGDVQLSVWPAWVTAIPTIDARVSLKVNASSEPATPSGAPSPRRSGDSVQPSGSPSSAP